MQDIWLSIEDNRGKNCPKVKCTVYYSILNLRKLEKTFLPMAAFISQRFTAAISGK